MHHNDHIRHEAAIFALVLAFVALVGMSGCSTVTPNAVTSHAASFSGNAQNSGILGQNTDRSLPVDANYVARYNALAAKWAKHFPAGLNAFAGVTVNTDGSFTIDAEHAVDKILMEDWERMGRKP